MGGETVNNLHMNGNIDEFAVRNTNAFSAAPVVVLTDTITVPTVAYGTAVNMTLISEDFTATAQPDNVRIVVYEEDVDAITENTDLVSSVSRDGGTTYTAATLSDDGEYQTGRRILAATVDISSQPAGTTMKYKHVTANLKDLKIHGTSLLWD